MWDPRWQSSAETQSGGPPQGRSPHSLRHSVAVCAWTPFLWVSSNCLCSCGFLLNDCIIRSHMAKARPKRESTLSSSSLWPLETLRAPSFRFRHRGLRPACLPTAQAPVRETLEEYGAGEGLQAVVQPAPSHASESEKGGKSLRRDEDVSTWVVM